MNAVKEKLSQKFEMKDLGPLHHFIGVKVIEDQLAGVIWIVVNPRILRRSYKSLVCMTANLSAHLSILMSNLYLVRVQMRCVPLYRKRIKLLPKMAKI